ncbi:MAG: hypothetical protein VB861_11160, partial [Planctomycetaceae bacterium]
MAGTTGANVGRFPRAIPVNAEDPASFDGRRVPGRLTESWGVCQSYFRLFFLQNAWNPDTNALL